MIVKYIVNDAYESAKEFEADLYGFLISLQGGPIYCGVIPPYHIAKEYFNKKSHPQVKWRPFELREKDYQRLVESILNDKKGALRNFPRFQIQNKGIRLEPEFDDAKTYKEWMQRVQDAYLHDVSRSNLDYSVFPHGSDGKKQPFAFFWHGPFSQWHPSKFEVAGIEFNCAEQFMMYSKAKLFGDETSALGTLAATDPKQQKVIGRNVLNFDQKTWDLFKEAIVFQGNMAKFSQNPDLQETLISTGDYYLVEASPYDKVWGIGMAVEDKGVNDPNNWKGQNLLGEALMNVRAALRYRLDHLKKC
ncbi:NADAR family protein [Hahella sp. HN01]|nr:NADAR family protein [Hahella sp. HN01]